MDLNQSTLFANYKERVKRLALYKPLLSLQNKNTKDIDGNPIDMYDLGLLALLFFYECKLMRKKDIGVDALGHFLFNLCRERYALDVQKAEMIAEDIIRTFRPASGKRLSSSFYDWETKNEDVVYCSILKAGKSDIARNRQYYELDEDGLELIFSTREYYSEFQLSINQMLLRKQLEKGEFGSALRQIDEMHINVESLYERIERIRQEIGRSVVSELVYNNYKRLIEDIHIRLERESKEFSELKDFALTALNDVRFKKMSDTDSRVYHSALQVNRELAKVHNRHDELLKACMDVQTVALSAVKESLYFSGVESFNFNKEIVSYCVSNGIAPERIKAIAQPFMTIESCAVWSPLAVFFPQRVMKREKGKLSSGYLEVSQESEGQDAITEIFFEKMMALCLLSISDQDTLKLGDFILKMRVERPELLKSRLFYDFWMTLHQCSPLRVDAEIDEQKHTVLRGIIGQLKPEFISVEVRESSGIIESGDLFRISNMTMNLERRYEL